MLCGDEHLDAVQAAALEGARGGGAGELGGVGALGEVSEDEGVQVVGRDAFEQQGRGLVGQVPALTPDAPAQLGWVLAPLEQVGVVVELEHEHVHAPEQRLDQRIGTSQVRCDRQPPAVVLEPEGDRRLAVVAERGGAHRERRLRGG